MATLIDADAKTGRTLTFGGLYTTGGSKETLIALEVAEKLPLVKRQDYEIRLISENRLDFYATWLHRPSDDILIPLPPTYGRMNAYQSYSESQIVNLLKSDTERVMTFDNMKAQKISTNH